MRGNRRGSVSRCRGGGNRARNIGLPSHLYEPRLESSGRELRENVVNQDQDKT
jgi:hypothetical protein